MFVAALLTHCLSPHPQPPMSMGSYATSVPAAIVALRRDASAKAWLIAEALRREFV